MIAAANMDAPDMKKQEMLHNLYITVLINPSGVEDPVMKLDDNNKAVVEHNVKTAAFEIFSRQIRDGDGNWTGNRMFVYLGKFTTPALGRSLGGSPAEVTKAVYPVNGNKLSVYNIIVKMDGAKDMIDKAMANIDFSALQQVIIKQ